MGALNDLSGIRFGRLLVLKLDEMVRRKSGGTLAMWLCKCDCGNTHISQSYPLTSGATKSCGCLQRELTSIKSRTHGMSKTRTYRSWAGMVNRCSNKTNKDYRDYGGRGISVCEQWKYFENFLLDMGEAPLLSSIDRIDNNGNYEPKNCRWATAEDQAKNKRTSRLITFNGETLNITDWARRLAITDSSLRQRIAAHGIESALTTQKKGIGHGIGQ